MNAATINEIHHRIDTLRSKEAFCRERAEACRAEAAGHAESARDYSKLRDGYEQILAAIKGVSP